MKKTLSSALAAALLMGWPSAVSAGDLTVTLSNGRATVIATNVPLSQILAEWARVGKTTIVNGDKLTGPPITLMLQDVPEREALDVLLRSASGYIVAGRQDVMANGSAFDRILIMPTSRAPAASAVNTTPQRFPNRPAPQPVLDPDQDEDQPVGPVMGPQGQMPQDVPQMQPGMPQRPPGSREPTRQPTIPPDAQTTPPGTAPRPGMPTAPAGQPSPYPITAPVVRPPGGGGGGSL